MPELPEVETVVRKLRPHLVGRTIEEVQVLWDRIVDRPDVEAFRRALTGAGITAVGRRGKFLVFSLDTGQTLLAHLRMTGKFFVRGAEEGPGEEPHVHVRVRLSDGEWLLFCNTRKFGRFYLVDDPEEVVGELGPEPLAPDFTPERLAGMLEGRRGELKRLLLNQNFIAGLGNIYVSEALWRAGVHPARVAGSLSPQEVERLHGAIVGTLEAGLRDGGTSLADREYVYPDGGLGGHQERLAVYDREGDRCPRCGYVIERFVQGQRSTYFCPRCQRGDAISIDRTT
jgi:formamidopyrimidine-DNA glycosylase